MPASRGAHPRDRSRGISMDVPKPAIDWTSSDANKSSIIAWLGKLATSQSSNKIVITNMKKTANPMYRLCNIGVILSVSRVGNTM